MYVSDDEVIARSDSSDFSKFIVTKQNLDEWMNSSKTRFKSKFFTNGVLAIFMVALAWVSFVSAFFLLILPCLGFHVVTVNNIPLYVYLFTLSLGFFITDFFRYRIGAKIKYSHDVCMLRNLFDEHKLSEYDIASISRQTQGG